MNEQSSVVVAEIGSGASRALDRTLRAYAGQPQFRSAEGHEVIFDHPFHRPVRAADLSFLDFSRPIDEAHAHALRALMGHRMLRNIYEADLPFIVELRSAQAIADRRAYYSADNRLLGEQVRPALERHSFAWIDEASEDTEEKAADLIGRWLTAYAAWARASRRRSRRRLRIRAWRSFWRFSCAVRWRRATWLTSVTPWPTTAAAGATGSPPWSSRRRTGATQRRRWRTPRS